MVVGDARRSHLVASTQGFELGERAVEGARARAAGWEQIELIASLRAAFGDDRDADDRGSWRMRFQLECEYAKPHPQVERR